MSRNQNVRTARDRFALTPGEQLGLLRVALRVKLKRAGLPPDAVNIVPFEATDHAASPQPAEASSGAALRS
jgi:hypothetical protein